MLDFIGNYEKIISSRQRFRMIARIRKKSFRRFVTTGAERIPGLPPSILTKWPAAEFIGQLTARP